MIVAFCNIKTKLRLGRLFFDKVNEGLSLAKIDHRIVVSMDHPTVSSQQSLQLLIQTQTFDLHSLRQPRASLQPL